MDSIAVNFDRRNFLLKTYAVSIGLIILYLFLYIAFSVPTYKIIAQLTFATILAIGFWIAALTKYERLASHYFIVGCFLFMCFSTSVSGGVENPGIIWFLFCPLVSFITLTAVMTRFWTITIIATLVAFYLFPDYLVLDKFSGAPYWRLFSCVLQFGMVYYVIKIFRSEVSKKTRELEAVNGLLKEKQQRLETYQYELMLHRDQLEVAESLAVERNNRLGEYLDQLLNVSRMEELHTGSLELSIQTVQRILAKAMDLESVAIWHLDEDNDQLNLIGSHNSQQDVSSEPAILTRENFSETFEILESGVIMLSPNENGEGQQLKLPFTQQSNEMSTIGCPYFIEGKFAGFFSCRARERKWSAEDVIFVRAISDTLPLAFKSHQRRRQQFWLEAKQRQITELNESLEQMVSQRTAQLKLRNEQLLSFAFINAHNIRGPICRLQGLRNLLMLAQSQEEVFALRDYISTSIEELDAITRKASTLLEDVPTLSELKATVMELMAK